MDRNGELNIESKKRVDELNKNIKNLRNQDIIFCGWAYREDSNITIASAQKKYFQLNQAHKHNIHLIENSKDTVGDAVFSRKFLDNYPYIKKINVVTSDYHIKRTSRIFNFVFGKNYKIKMISTFTDPLKNNVMQEKKSLKKFQETFFGVPEGDIEKIISTMYKKHPFYNGDVY